MGIDILFCGDVYFNPDMNKRIVISEKVEKILNSEIIKCINIEAPIKKDANKNKKIGPSLFQNEEILKEIINETVVSNLANNHIMDYGEEGLKNIIDFCKGGYIGAGNCYEEIYKPFTIEKDDVTAAIISIAEGGFGVYNGNNIGYAWMLDSDWQRRIKKLKEQYNYVICVCHAGLENVSLPLPEIRNLYHAFIDYGCDMVIGHHPHVIQGSEKYNDKMIFYSLGNFMFDSVFEGYEANGNSIGVLVSLDKSEINTEIIPFLYRNREIDLSCISKAIYDKACRELLSNNYEQRINDICLNFYNKTYKEYFKQAFGVYSLKTFMNFIFRFFMRKYDINEDMLYHNLRIETHYWTTLRGMEEKRKTKNV